MIDHPNLLVVIDDITQVETVEWAERLCVGIYFLILLLSSSSEF